MRPAYAPDAVRAAEAVAQGGLPDGALMARAATAVARRATAMLGGAYGRRVVLLVGSGDNGGDALHAGALLARRGARVDAVLLGDRHHGGGAAALRGAGGRLHAGPLPPGLLAAGELVVDGITGIGNRGGLRGAAADAADALAAGAPAVLAVDVPSGVDAATGEVAGAAVRADVTVTMGALKPGLLVDPGRARAGVVEVAPIGVHPSGAVAAAVDAADVAAWVPVPPREADKYARGVVGVVAGGPRYVGATVLAVGGALVAGAGMVRLVAPRDLAAEVRGRFPEVVVEAGDGGPDGVRGTGRVQAWVVGPGLAEDAAELARAVLATGTPAVVDAGAVAELAAHGHPGVLATPHAGELARGLGVDRPAVEAARLAHAGRAAAAWRCAVLLKGATTVVAASGEPALVSATAPPWTATAGAGDVLAGAAGALLAGGLTPRHAGAAAAFLHGLAAAEAAAGDVPVRATDLLVHWAAAVRAVRG